MKILVASDLHDDYEYTVKLIDLFKKENFDKLYLLGDIGSDSILLLNEIHEKIIAVCGNNDLFDDIELAKFRMPYINFDFAFNKVIILSHGHYYDEYNYKENYNIFFKGHSHISQIKTYDDKIIANPGSLSFPKDGYHSYMVFNKEYLEIKDINSSKSINKYIFKE